LLGSLILILTVVASPIPTRADIAGFTLWGGFLSAGVWGSNGQIWNTYADTRWVLGVSAVPHGLLLNSSSTNVSLSPGSYWLYAEPADLGSAVKLDVDLSDGTTLSAIFEVYGANGVQSSWSRISGSTLLTLGFADGFADAVSAGEVLAPDGINDFYLRVNIDPLQPVPEPANLLVFGGGLVCLAAIRRKFHKA